MATPVGWRALSLLRCLWFQGARQFYWRCQPAVVGNLSAPAYREFDLTPRCGGAVRERDGVPGFD